MKVLRVLIVAFCLVASLVQAQPKIVMGLDFSMGFPVGEFGDNVENTGYGMTFDMGYRMGHSPVLIGGSFGFLQYGSESRVVPFSSNTPDILIELDTTNNIFMGHFLVRYEFGGFEPRVKPYVEGLVGLHYLWTQTSIDEDDDDDFTTTNFDDTAPSFGIGGGVLIGLHRGTAGLFRIDLHLGARYLFGGEANYLTEGAILRDDNSVVYRFNESSTNLVTTNFGIVFSF